MAIWFIKLPLFLITLLSLAYFAVPPATAALLSGAPKLWASLNPWLAPPYLFIAVHLIIALIWKLSDYQKHWDSPSPEIGDDKPPHPDPAVKVPSFHNFPPPPLLRNPSPESWPQISPPRPSADPSPPSPEVKRSVAAGPAAETKSAAAVSVASAASLVDEEEDDGKSMEATWRAIERSASRTRRSSPSPASPAVAWDDGQDEMRRRFDEFIKGKRDQLRLERHESNQRRLLGAIN